MKKASIVVLLFVLVIASALSGCSSKKTDEGNQTPSETAPATSSNNNDPEITITWWTDMTVDVVKGFEDKTANYGDFENIIAKKFMDMHPNVTVKVEVLTWEDLPVKVPAALAAGTQPDIYKDYIGRSAGYAWQDAVENMEDLFTPEELAEYSDSFMSANRVNGIIHGIPLTAWAYGFLYNKAITDKIGTTDLFPTPENPYWTLDQFNTAIKASKKDGYVPLGLQVGQPQGDQPIYLYFNAHGASRFQNGDYSKTTINTPEAVKTVEDYVQMNNDGLLQPSAATAGYEEVNALAYNGKLVGLYDSAGFQNQIDNALAEGNATGEHNWVLVAPPGDGKTVFGPTNLVVFKQKDEYKKKMIAELIKLITSDEFLLPYAITAGQFAGKKSVLENPESTPTQNMKTNARILAEKGTIDLGISSPKFAEFRPLLQPEMQAALLKKKTAAQAISDYEKNVNAVLSK